ncbi:hypothetical protein MJO28_001786 [Puccinia striiformis f. sp. tritici]|uniref:Uncharacterized protein n=1 Tax=Puccinia striiformis f. sp. tritici TaxID=168172 RepID=A0ACC0EUY9_9BASI|nr:hypothetical protein MJO28_001786 [Puccinia striiformis f. sp. tritici]
MVEININTTRAISKKIKAATSQRDQADEENITNSLVPNDVGQGVEKNASIVQDPSSTENTGNRRNVDPIDKSSTSLTSQSSEIVDQATIGTQTTTAVHNPTEGGKSADEVDGNFVELINLAACGKPSSKDETLDDKTRILNRAIEAQNSGDNLTAGILFEALSKLANPNRARSTLSTSAMGRIDEESLDIEGDLLYAIGTGTSHNFIGFAPILDENIKRLRAPIPLTIFNTNWQELAMSHYLDNRPKSEGIGTVSASEKSSGYKGFKFVSEWSMNHSSWTKNHRQFHKTLVEVYEMVKFAKLLAIHKATCDDLINNQCFMVAFRYDMIMRSNTFSHRILVKGKSCIPDISQRKDQLVEECYTKCRNQDELGWEDNLYSPAGS